MIQNKVLIISGIPFRNDTNLGKTLSTLFSSFSSNELVQLYFSPQTPNVKACASYYQINEKQLFRSFFGLIEKRCGKIIFGKDVSGADAGAEANPSAILALRQHILIPIFRDLLWCVSKWKSRKLNRWLDENKPDVVFCILPGSVKSCRIMDYVARRYNSPIVLFVTDDYYNDHELHPGILRRWYYQWLQKSIDKMAFQVKRVVGCSELAAKEFGEKYDVPYEVIFTPSGAEYVSMKTHPQTDTHPVVFRYFGNLGLERWKPLVELGHAIAAYNNGDQKAILEVYSNRRYPDAIAQLDISNGCVFKGWVQGDDYMKLLQEADVAVHVESFSEEMCRRTRLSVSTKIADYLGAGKCILVIGREDLASVQHVQDVAHVVNNIEDLKEKLGILIENGDYRQQLSNKARDLAIEQHSIKEIPQRLVEIINSFCVLNP